MNAGEADKIAAILSIGTCVTPNALSSQIQMMNHLFPNFSWSVRPTDRGDLVVAKSRDADDTPLHLPGRTTGGPSPGLVGD